MPNKKTRKVIQHGTTGRFASKADVAADPAGTMTRTLDDKSAEKFLAKLNEGGRIVRTAALSDAEVDQADAEGRVWSNYVYVPAGA